MEQSGAQNAPDRPCEVRAEPADHKGVAVRLKLGVIWGTMTQTAENLSRGTHSGAEMLGERSVTDVGTRQWTDGDRARALEEVLEITTSLAGAIGTVIEGKPEVIQTALTALLAEGHLLIEDVPGVGKTMLAKTLARSIDCTVRRIQFTPDLLPSDVTGVSMFNQDVRAFEFRPGAIFANVVVGDEINRASPKTQSAMLECMEEGQVTSDGVTRPLPKPFFVIATQNPMS